MQYKVPQNIDIEDKVIAGLTLRQFMFIMVAGGVGLLEYYFFVGPLGFLFLPVALITAVIGIAFAFVKINDRPFEIFIVSAAKSLLAPRIRVWQKDDDDIPKHIETNQTRAAVRSKKGVKEVHSSLERLAIVIDSGGTSEEKHDPERKTNVTPVKKPEPQHVKDILAKTEEVSASVDKYLSEAKEYVDKTKKEPTLDKVATVKTKKEDFTYAKIDLSDEKQLEEELKEVENRQKDLERRLEASKVEKFDREGK